MNSKLSYPGPKVNPLPELNDILNWMRTQAAADPYGEFTVRVIMHAGRISRIERGVVQKLKPENGGSHADRAQG